MFGWNCCCCYNNFVAKGAEVGNGVKEVNGDVVVAVEDGTTSQVCEDKVGPHSFQQNLLGLVQCVCECVRTHIC